MCSIGGEQQECRLAKMHRRICHALHDVHLAARMPRAFLNREGINVSSLLFSFCVIM